VTSSADQPGGPDRVLLAAGTAAYDHPGFEALDKVPASLRTIVESLTGLGYTAVADAPGYKINPKLKSLRAAVREAGRAAPVVVVYYTGHGVRPERDTYYLVTRKSAPADLDESALPAADLPKLLTRRDNTGELLAGQPTVLVILDCCYSGSGGMEVLSNALRQIGNENTWVIASAGDLQYAQQGLFASAFADALRRPTTGSSQPFLSLETVVQAVNDARPASAEQEARFFPPATGSSGIPPFLPNPSYQPGAVGLTISEQHWLSRLRGGPDDSTTGFYLTGRTGRVRASKRLARWMTDPARGGLAVVTGSPGAGKSALLSLPVLLSEPSGRQDLLRAAGASSLIQRTAALLPAGTVDIAVHARGLNTDQVAARIAEGLHRRADSASALLADLHRARKRVRRVVVIDAVDEATSPGSLLGSLLLPLARQPGLKVVAGARRHVLSRIGKPDLTIDLDAKKYRDPQALTDYVHQLLIASREPDVTTPYPPGPGPAEGDREEVATFVATAVAQRATASGGGAESFLVGRLLALSVRGRGRALVVLC
jgi:hypothetical protein